MRLLILDAESTDRIILEIKANSHIERLKTPILPEVSIKIDRISPWNIRATATLKAKSLLANSGVSPRL